MIDVSSQLYSYLLTQSAVTDLVGSGSTSRIFIDTRTPEKLYRPETGPSILFRPRGGMGDYAQCVYQMSYQFKCYGDSSLPTTGQRSSAFDVYKALHDSLVNNSFGNVKNVATELTYQIVEEFALNWVYSLCFFSFFVVDDGT